MRAHVLSAWFAGLCLLTHGAAPPARSEAAPTPSCESAAGELRPSDAATAHLARSAMEAISSFRAVLRGEAPEIASDLYILSVWAEELEATLPKGAPAETLPKPLIASQEGRVLGRLPVGFPDDPPRSSGISFSDWLHGIPRQIRVAVKDPTVVGDHTLILQWNPESKTYVRSKTEK